MSSVGKIDEVALLVRQAEQLAHQLKQGELGSRLSILGRGRVTEPPAEPDIEHRHQERGGGRRMIALVGAGRGARDGHGGAERNAAQLGVGVMTGFPVAWPDAVRALEARAGVAAGLGPARYLIAAKLW